MTREDAFIADIIANPADDAVRLIYADWLDGQGREEYGEFIRRGVHGQTHQCVTWDGKSRPVGGGSIWEAWPGSIAAYSDGLPHASFEWFYRRGFIAEVRCTCANWLDCGPALVRRQPIERMVLADCKPWQRDTAFEWWRFDSNDNGVNRSDYPCYLPDIIFRHLNTPWSIEWSRYSNESAALDALSKAALLWAKQTEPATSSA